MTVAHVWRSCYCVELSRWTEFRRRSLFETPVAVQWKEPQGPAGGLTTSVLLSQPKHRLPRKHQRFRPFSDFMIRQDKNVETARR